MICHEHWKIEIQRQKKKKKKKKPQELVIQGAVKVIKKNQERKMLMKNVKFSKAYINIHVHQVFCPYARIHSYCIYMFVSIIEFESCKSLFNRMLFNLY